MKSLALLALLFSQVALGRAADKPACNARELKRRDCRLQVGAYMARLTSTTVARDSGTFRAVDDLPLKGEGVEWEKMVLHVEKGWPVLQFWIWDAGQGEPKVRNLHWYIADGTVQPMKILAEGVVRRRRDKIYDAMETHGVKSLGPGRLEWNLRGERKILEKAK
ncbi:MAG TPA: hypothetical protein PKC28_03740 [Bdellovibrionales bacterium]|nr:hypothetical protein [Bdellovibrionales bacterium]